MSAVLQRTLRAVRRVQIATERVFVAAINGSMS